MGTQRPVRYVVGNWKMNLLAREAIAFAQQLSNSVTTHTSPEVWVAPSFLSIPALSEIVKGTPIKLGSQTVHGEVKGAYTGEISVSMLKEFGVTFSLIGHSERRWILGETDTIVAAKAAGALRQGLTPVFCVGESLEEYDRGLTREVLRIQLNSLFNTLQHGELSKVIIAYEPCWAIGTGKVPTPEVIGQVHRYLFDVCHAAQDEGPKAILYGGSVTEKNFAEILSIPHVDGGLIGGASLSVESFTNLISIASHASA